MINKKLSGNWQKFLNFSSKVKILDNPIDIEDRIKIPLTSLEINAYLLYYIFEEIYPKFINDQLNVIDIIISDYELENIVLGAYIYQMNKPGIHENINVLKKDEINLKIKDLNNHELLLNQIQKSVFKSRDVTITNFRIIKKRGLDLINRHMENLEKLPLIGVIESFLDLIQILIKNELLIFYPLPPIIGFLKKSFHVLKNLKLSKIFHNFIIIFPPIDTGIILKTSISPILFIVNQSSPSDKIEDLKISFDWIKISEDENLDLNKIRADLKLKYIFSINLNVLVDFFLDVIESSLEISQEKLKLIFQKFLFGIRSYQNYWNISPKPLIYNSFIRFLLKVVGFDLNLRKLSHWAIPEFFFSIFNSYGGMRGNILLFHTDQENNTVSRNNFLIVQIENGIINNIELGKFGDLNLRNNSHFEDLRIKASEIYGTISLVIKIDKKLITYLLDSFFLNFYKITIFKILKLVRLIKNPNYFEIYPEIPIYRLIKTKNSLKLLKTLLFISIDKHEF